MGSLIQLEGDQSIWYTRLVKGLQGLRESNTLCDVALVSQDGHMVRCHSAVMAAVSPALQTLLKAKVASTATEDDNCVFVDDIATGR